MDTMEQIQHLNARYLENEIFTPFCKAHGFKEVPKAEFDPIDYRDILDMAKAFRLMLGGMGEEPIFSKNELRAMMNYKEAEGDKDANSTSRRVEPNPANVGNPKKANPKNR